MVEGMSSSHRRAPGLTLSEVVVALGLLAFVALVIVGVFLALLKTSAKNREQAMAELMTESLLEKATAQGHPRFGVEGRTSQRHEAVLQPDGARFFYQVDALELPAEVADPAGRNWQVTVTVGWWLDESKTTLEQAGDGFGNRFVKGVRTVYQRDGDRV
jgi:type II secretory pathway component PulJ